MPSDHAGPTTGLPFLPGIADPRPLANDGVVSWYRGRQTGGDVLVGMVGDGPAADALRQRLADDGAAISALRHAHLLPCLAVHAAAGRAGIVHPWPEGGTIDDLCMATTAGIRSTGERLRTLHLIVGLVHGLAAIHEAGLVHHGLLPARLHLHDDQVRISGLGLAATGSPPRPRPEHAMLAPELILGLDADIRADIHAVGALLLRLFTGRWPWAVGSAADLDAWARAELPKDPLLTGPLADDGLEAVLRASLARRAPERYATPADLLDDLELLVAGFAPVHARTLREPSAVVQAPGMATLDRPVRPHRPAVAGRPRPTWPGVAAGLAGVLVVGSAAGWLVRGRPVAPPPSATAAPAVVAAAVPATTTASAPVSSAPAGAVGNGPRWAARSGRDSYGDWAEIAVGKTVQRLRLIPAGDLWMGSPPDEIGRDSDETRFLARLSSPLWMADCETTQQLYQEVMGTNPSHFRGDDLPVDTVSWTDATLFCQRLAERLPGVSAHLPTEAWWERACRAGGSGAFATAADGTALASWDEDSSGAAPHPVRRLAPNAWGLFDMHGNALEWTADAMAPYPEEMVTDRQVWRGAQRVARGGAWNAKRGDCRSASRYHLMAPAHFSHLGFRFAVDG